MKEIGKRLIAVFAALALVFSVFTVGTDTTEVKAEQAQAEDTVVDELNVTKDLVNVDYTVKNLTVASSGSITLGSKSDDTNPSNKMSIVRVTGRAEVDGRITLRVDSGMEGVLEVGK
ncbi:MAG: hypothetical protein IKR54_03495, partial [Lachnospiraceae bacterium]|nr:hypothetical protein [Lachnospiraceae bacterium]